MKKIILLFIFSNTLINCQSAPKTTFSEVALNDKLEQVDGVSVDFAAILEKHSGKPLFIDVWASWCRDCIEGLPKLKAFQADHQEMVYVFLSLDKTVKAWKKGVKRYEIKGDHYFMSSGRKGPLGSFLDLDWIPRFLIVNPDGKIEVFRAIETTDINLLNYLK